METNTDACPSAYAYPLLIKHILYAPIAYDPEREIVYRGSSRFTYRQFRERVARLASALIALGVKKGDTVGVMDWDSNRYLECYFAIPMIGAVLHTINVRLSPEQLVYTIGHAEDSVLLMNADFLPALTAIRGRVDTVRSLVLLRDDPEIPADSAQFAGEYEALLAAHEPLAEFPDFDENTRATTFYTTGTTGLPKAVFFSHRQLDDVYMPITPMFHVHAWGIPYIATWLGVKQVYPGKYSPAVLNALIAREKVTFSHCVPTILGMLLSDSNAADTDYTGWKVIIGGAALPKTLCATALDRGINIFCGYGMSETGPVVSLVRLDRRDLELSRDEQVELRARTGTPVGLAYIRILGPDGNEVAMDDHASGEITLRAPWLTQGYLKDRTNSEKLWEGGWLHTQDVAVKNGKGSVRITDRLKDVIKVGGEWLSSLEIEDIIAGHPAVAEVGVIGSPDEKWGEVPLACVARQTMRASRPTG